MDYARIYAEFIADRLAKQPEKPAYFERHHVMPKSLGGGDEPENIIRLTPEDHLFAHLLLAKIHGGKMWVAVHAMCYLLNDSTGMHRKYANRAKFGYVRRSLAWHYRESFAGPDGPQADKAKYTLHHHDGSKARGNRFELEQQTGIPRQQISALLRGEKKTNRGWYSKRHNPNGLTASESLSLGRRSKEKFLLFNENGETWHGTRGEFEKTFGTALNLSGNNSCLGWYTTALEAAGHSERIKKKAQAAADARGDISGQNNPMFGADRRKPRRIKVRHKSGEIFEGCSVDFAEKIGMGARADYQRLMKTLRGKKVVDGFVVKSFHGWFPLEVEP